MAGRHLAAFVVGDGRDPSDPGPASTISSAFQILISPDSTSRSTTVSKISGVAPAAVATLRACSVMWPRWMPSVTRARSAEKFCARPTAAMTSASSRDESTLRDAQVHADRRVGLQRSADDADLERQLDLADQGAVVGLGPARERGVVGSAGGIGVGAGLDRPPVVAGGQGHRVDAVHDALVVGRGPVGVDRGELARDDDAVADLLAVVALGGEVLGGNLAPTPEPATDRRDSTGCAERPGRR